ncbi:hypothetical protein RNP97_004525 [Enterobacter bugandensis]|uniref:hypothetical protein n=1 Tax=Enterobacter TaxID=547 RepID=UPI000F84B61B|nr:MULTISPECIES: hypothetical protein [Enterobacter]ELF8873138.1 hypothetical protein [Enterobacter bugandensis]ELF8874089.1 hypothetical protein [Enterobacter bugandensis]ELQ3995185.1 hypothetical protein [Enterobacter bugandensis]ELQ3996791.1 hypothetical protein [Enterobacter bugandensis]ELV3040832.1 hypothetical protein [Enterobacter bugandensis]
MIKFIIPIINLLLCAYLVLAYILCWIEFESWNDKIIAFCIITLSAYILSLVMNKLLPRKIRILGGILDVLSGPLMIIGAFACIAVLEPWPLKIIGLFIWVVAMLHLPSFVNIDEE